DSGCRQIEPRSAQFICVTVTLLEFSAPPRLSSALDIPTKETIMPGKLSGKVAVVTGASKGIGASIALHLAAEGAAVVVNYSSSRQGADRIVGEINGNGGKAVAVQANLAKEAEVRKLFAEAKKAFGSLDILVNNAGVYDFVPLENIT